MWLIENDQGNVKVMDDGQQERFQGPVSVALLGFGRAMHRMEEAHSIVNTMLAELDKVIPDTRPPWFDEHRYALEQLVELLSCGAAPKRGK